MIKGRSHARVQTKPNLGPSLRHMKPLPRALHITYAGQGPPTIFVAVRPCCRYNGLVSLCGFLQSSRTIRSLVLRDNWLHTEAAKFIANALIDNTSMTSLDLACAYAPGRCAVVSPPAAYTV